LIALGKLFWEALCPELDGTEPRAVPKDRTISENRFKSRLKILLEMASEY
jgi:hypothetical protein